MNNTEKAYKEIFKVLKKHKDTIVFDVKSLETKAKLHLFGVELTEKYGLKLDASKIICLDWNKFGEYMSIGWWGDKYQRTISWSDNDTQPKDELLLKISFSTGAYIFGYGSMFNKDYPTKFFQKFFNELKIYNPKFTDSHNHSLYFSMDNAKNIFNSFDEIFNKYNELNEKDIKKRKIQKMKDELSKLEAQK